MFNSIITAYHGTNEENASSIIATGFSSRHSDVHWLGQGIYFFCDKRLASRWTKRHKKHRKSVKGVVLEVEINTENRKVLNLLNYDDKIKLRKHAEKLQDIAQEHNTKLEFRNEKQIRCAVLDHFKEVERYEIMIALFNTEGNRNYSRVFEKLMISTAEVQICVSNFCQIGTIVIKNCS